MRTRRCERVWALLFGALCHGGFLAAVSALAHGLSTGLRSGRGTLHGGTALLANGALALQFPLLHSALITRRGRLLLGRLAPARLGPALAPTTYALLASVQIGSTFLLWSPSGRVLWEPAGAARALHLALYAGAWLFLGKALLDAGLGLQTGWIGWNAVWRGREVAYPGLPVQGLFSRCRQPIYLGFALVLWTAPGWTPDRVVLAALWSTYCVLGPVHKERRFRAIYGKQFDTYRERVPYLFPRLLP